MVRAAGLEPAWGYPLRILSPVCLPFHHARDGSCTVAVSKRKSGIHFSENACQSVAPEIGATYATSRSHGKKIQVSWLTSVMNVSTISRPLGLA